MHGDAVVLESTRLGIFKFYTVDSNLLMGLAALIFLIAEINVLKGRKTDISKNLYIFKLIATAGVTLTFIVVFVFFGAVLKVPLSAMLQNSNLFFHLIIPVLSIINFMFIERSDKLRFPHTIWGISTALIYGIFYAVNVFSHMENGVVSPKYDFYYFAQGGFAMAVVALPMMLLFIWIISIILWIVNRKKGKAT